VPADVNYMYIPDKKTTESEYTKYATEVPAKSLPLAVHPSAQMLNGCPKVSKSPAKESVR
jgi:hypothetical protein